MNPQRTLATYPSPDGTARPHRPPADARDAERVRAMAAGDESALGELYDRWHPLLYSLVLNIVRDARDAEEVLEDVLWQAWRQAASFNPSRGGVGSWLTSIARSRALDRVRARRRARDEVSLDEPESAPTLASSEPGPADDTEAADLRVRVRDALALLPQEQRETMRMAYFGGLSQSEIATATGQPLGTVKTRMRLAMQKLRDTLAVLREEAP